MWLYLSHLYEKLASNVYPPMNSFFKKNASTWRREFPHKILEKYRYEE